MLETVGVVEIAGTLRQVAGVRNVKHLAFGMFELFQGQRRLATAGAADHDHGRRLTIDGVLRVVEGDGLVQQMNRRAFRMQVAHGLCILDGLIRINVGNFAFIYRRAAQKARLVVLVIGDHFQHQRADLVAVANQGEQQPVGVIEFGTVELAVAEIGKLLDLCAAKVVTGDGISHLAIAGLDARDIKPGVFKNLHVLSRLGSSRHGFVTLADFPLTSA